MSFSPEVFDSWGTDLTANDPDTLAISLLSLARQPSDA